MRAIYCLTCGKVRPTPADDAAKGLFERRVHGNVAYDMSCDLCGEFLPKGAPAVAITVPKDRMPDWEKGYLQ